MERATGPNACARTYQGICGVKYGGRRKELLISLYVIISRCLGLTWRLEPFNMLDVRVPEFKTYGYILYRIPRLLKRWMIVPTKLLGHLDSWTGFILEPGGSHDLHDGWISGNPGLAWLVNKLTFTGFNLFENPDMVPGPTGLLFLRHFTEFTACLQDVKTYFMES